MIGKIKSWTHSLNTSRLVVYISSIFSLSSFSYAPGLVLLLLLLASLTRWLGSFSHHQLIFSGTGAASVFFSSLPLLLLEDLLELLEAVLALIWFSTFLMDLSSGRLAIIDFYFIALDKINRQDRIGWTWLGWWNYFKMEDWFKWLLEF